MRYDKVAKRLVRVYFDDISLERARWSIQAAAKRRDGERLRRACRWVRCTVTPLILSWVFLLHVHAQGVAALVYMPVTAVTAPVTSALGGFMFGVNVTAKVAVSMFSGVGVTAITACRYRAWGAGSS